MLPQDLSNQLISIVDDDDFAELTNDIVETLETDGNGVEMVEPILRFIEEHPAIDYGMPGALVHFVERFFRSGYEDKLLESVNRRPTDHTLWMVNRIINGVKDATERQRYVDVLSKATMHPLAGEATRERARHFLGIATGV